MIHSVDFHAATGPGGGAAALQVDPGDEKSMTFKALVPGLYYARVAEAPALGTTPVVVAAHGDNDVIIGTLTR